MSPKQAARPKAKQLCSQPRWAQLFFDHRQPVNGLLRGAYAARGFESDRHSGLQGVLTDGASHHQANRQRCVGWLFAGRSLDEVSARHHRDDAGPRDVAQRQQVSRAKNHLHVRRSTSLLERCHLVVKGLPAAAKYMGTCDNDIDLVGAGLDRAANLRDPLRQRRQARGKTGGNGGDTDSAALEARAERSPQRCGTRRWRRL